MTAANIQIQQDYVEFSKKTPVKPGDPITLDEDGNPVVEREKSLRIFPGEESFVNKPVDQSWILDRDQHEDMEMFLRDDKFEYADIKQMYTNANTELDPLYLVKWKNLSYLDLTWEPLSSIIENDKELRDFERFNRSLDNGSRQKMMGFSYAHKQLIKIF